MEIFVLGILILLNGFFALSEIALVSSKKARLEQSKREGSKGAKTALYLLTDSEKFLSAIQVGITLIGIVTGVYGGMNIADDVSPLFQKFAFTEPYAHEIALVLTVAIITYVSIVIGELVPKTIALGDPEKIAIRVAPVILYFSRAFFPFVKLLSLSTNIVVKLTGIKKHTEQFSEAELIQMIKIASIEGVIEKEQNFIHENVFYFSDKKAKHIMTHRTDVEWIDIDKPDHEIKRVLSEVQHSKIVCSKGELDNFQGILNLQDFYKYLSLFNSFKIEELIIQPLIVPENTDAQKVLDLIRQKKTHICCVVNEYGGLEGIITLHDIIENIVGQIPDEDETYDPDIYVRDDKSVLVSGDAPIEALINVIENFTIDFEKIDYSTVAGFVLNKINIVPQIGYKFDYMGHRIEIIDIDGNRIDKILITKKN
ncbi:MAG: HlyC/CorC family transporter [Alphaproteobacteria bacterium]|nr:MAG: HlyC/CorC family transporter [Alphaproteobacteria bacterium]